MAEETLVKLVSLLSRENEARDLRLRHEKMHRILLLLGKGAVLATAIALPGTSKLFKDFLMDKSDWEEWKIFNHKYLTRTLRAMEKQKIVEVQDFGDHATVILTEKGKKKILKFGVGSLTISKPDRWDGKWRMVFYDVLDGKRTTRDKFRSYLINAGFFPLQESVYIHAYPCENEIEFLKNFLGIGAEVRIVIAEKIENDGKFKEFFGLNH